MTSDDPRRALEQELARFHAAIPYMTLDELKAALKEVKAALRYLYERRG